MPRLSVFYGIAIYMYYNDHPPPHFHARHEGEDAVFEVPSLAMVTGKIKPRAHALVVEWAAQHRAELAAAWVRCREGGPPEPIPPLE